MFTLSPSPQRVKKEAFFTLRISSSRFIPRWLVFSIDTIISTIAFVCAFIMFYDFNIHALFAHKGLETLVYINLLISIAVSLTFKTYAGIIRLTSLQDMARIFNAIFFNAVLLGVVKLGLSNIESIIILPLNVILKYFLILFFFSTSYRFLIKLGFESIRRENTLKKSILIFGAGESGMITKHVINHEAQCGLKVIGFLDDNLNKVGKYIDGIKIYNARTDIQFLVDKYKVEEVIISIQNLDINRKRELVDICLLHEIKVVTIPRASNWIDGSFNLNQLRNIKIEELLEREVITIQNAKVTDELRNKRILVTGAAGSIGSEVVRQVLKFNPELLVLCDQAETALYNIELEFKESFPNACIQPFIADIRNKERMEYLFDKYKPEIVFHAAAYKHVPMMEHHPSEAILTNVGGTKNVADLSVKYQVEKFVMISTDKAVNPTNVMGASKRIAEIYTQSLNDYYVQNGIESSTRFITTRFGNVLGSNGSVIPRFKEQIEKGGPITVTHPDINRYFMTIPEACQLVIEAGTMGNGGEIFVFDMGKSVKIVDLAKKMIQLSGLTPDKDIQIVFTGLRPGEKLYEELLNDSECVQKTHHEKIKIARVRKYKYEWVEESINELLSSATNFQEKSIVRQMKLIVPEFKSKQSVYEELDAPHLSLEQANIAV
ncbi:polysaccharide biosynthesis protein [Solitalea canadensis]|uniref:Putative nucleoside-diphosphate sugar epimerase n=1 Tax=Solitalea canadensis (strain ATCC 29591 / DSM 3403 / JCM 21819 / LMG 8368 / NBRC 15130 / NCIMB 12057 / USAM 9D) TaxID=929556 RepID=H8KXQ5_SOLCM|nr:nucleoside-diphosphate sugar epimerase/dehydratase [Solitalea canadensis]AFD05470.1 putative nucleoside-diphosphate sugar epimerase [Solitalea canadensis DSM 3403]